MNDGMGKLIELMESLPDELQLNMNTWGNGHLFDAAGYEVDRAIDCGTPACMGGWAERLMREEGRQIHGTGWRDIAGFLGIDLDTAKRLFTPTHSDGDRASFMADPGEPGHITRDMAVKALRRVAEGYTGTRIWDFAE